MKLTETEQSAAANFAKALFLTDLANGIKVQAQAVLKSKVEKYPEDWIAGYPVAFEVGGQTISRKIVLRKRNFWSLAEVPEVTVG